MFVIKKIATAFIDCESTFSRTKIGLQSPLRIRSELADHGVFTWKWSLVCLVFLSSV